jgi:GT2 family glycosyltransferase
MLVSIIIVNYNTFTLTCDCIKSIIFYTQEVNYEIILVDNASTECDAMKFKEIYPLLILIKNNHNLGFSKANNIGIRHSKGNIVVLLNSDTYLIEDSITKAVGFLMANPQIGALSVSLRFPNGKLQHYTRRSRSIRNELLDICRPLVWLLPYKKRATLLLNQYYNGDFNVEADWVGGAFFMLPIHVIQALPEKKLDERYFMYGEDELWCYQIKKLGYKIFNFSGTHIIHLEGGSNKRKKPALNWKNHNKSIAIYKMQGNNIINSYVLKTILFFKQFTIYCIRSMIYLFKK